VRDADGWTTEPPALLDGQCGFVISCRPVLTFLLMALPPVFLLALSHDEGNGVMHQPD
jgi:hypothetical protein